MKKANENDFYSDETKSQKLRTTIFEIFYFSLKNNGKNSEKVKIKQKYFRRKQKKMYFCPKFECNGKKFSNCRVASESQDD